MMKYAIKQGSSPAEILFHPVCNKHMVSASKSVSYM